MVHVTVGLGVLGMAILAMASFAFYRRKKTRKVEERVVLSAEEERELQRERYVERQKLKAVNTDARKGELWPARGSSSNNTEQSESNVPAPGEDEDDLAFVIPADKDPLFPEGNFGTTPSKGASESSAKQEVSPESESPGTTSTTSADVGNGSSAGVIENKDKLKRVKGEKKEKRLKGCRSAPNPQEGAFTFQLTTAEGGKSAPGALAEGDVATAPTGPTMSAMESDYSTRSGIGPSMSTMKSDRSARGQATDIGRKPTDSPRVRSGEEGKASRLRKYETAPADTKKRAQNATHLLPPGIKRPTEELLKEKNRSRERRVPQARNSDPVSNRSSQLNRFALAEPSPSGAALSQLNRFELEVPSANALLETSEGDGGEARGKPAEKSTRQRLQRNDTTPAPRVVGLEHADKNLNGDR